MNPLDQLRAMRARRAQANADQDRVDPHAGMRYDLDDTQPILTPTPKRDRSPRRRRVATLAAGVIFGLAAGLTIPALADGNSPPTDSATPTSSAAAGGGDTTTDPGNPADQSTEPDADTPTDGTAAAPCPAPGPNERVRRGPAPRPPAPDVAPPQGPPAAPQQQAPDTPSPQNDGPAAPTPSGTPTPPATK